MKTGRKVGTGRQVVGTGRTIRKRIEAERKKEKQLLENVWELFCCWKGLFLSVATLHRMLALKGFWIRIKDSLNYKSSKFIKVPKNAYSCHIKMYQELMVDL